MATIRWSEEKSCKFINIYEKYECLWNSKSKEYRNRDARGTAIRKIIGDMEELDINMTEDEVRNRIKAIRTTYMAELRKVEKAARSGVSVDDLYHPTCAWFKDADRFLRHVCSLRPVFENMSSQTKKQVTQGSRSTSTERTNVKDYASSQEVVNAGESDTTVDIPEGSTSNTQVESFQTPGTSRIPSNVKRLKRSSDDINLSAINKLQNICETANECLKEDEFDIFGRHVAIQLRNLNIIRALEVQDQISSLLSKTRIRDIKEKQTKNVNLLSQPQTLATNESSSSYWANSPHESITSNSNSQYSYEELINTVQPSQLSATKDVLSQALDTIL